MPSNTVNERYQLPTVKALLGEVGVGPGIETGETICGAVPGGNHHDRQMCVVGG